MRIRIIRLQRNLLLMFSILLLLSNILMVFVIKDKEKLVVLTPTLDKELTIGTSFVSEDYLLLRAEQITSLLFNIRQENCDYNSAQLLRQVSSNEKYEFQTQLDEFIKDVKQKKYYYVFNKQAYEIDNQKLTVKFTGYLDTFLNDKKITSNFKIFKIAFSNQKGIVTLTSFEEVQDENLD
jgi:conjugal transfer pilus assembly protein TraE